MTAKLPPEVVKPVIASAKVAQIIQLIKDNQLLTAALLFISWQMGLMAQASQAIGGVC